MFKQSISINDGNYTLTSIIKEKDSLISRLQERVIELENFILNIEIELDKEKPISIRIDDKSYVIKSEVTNGC